MSEFSPEETEQRKKAVFDCMSPRRQKHILKKIGYEKWNPFAEPKDPIDMRQDKSRRTTQQLVREFLQSRSSREYSNSYGRGALEMALGIVNNEDRFVGMYDFAVWHRDLLKKEGHESSQ